MPPLARFAGAVLLAAAAAGAAPTAAGEGAPVGAQRRAAVLADIGRLRLELDSPDELRGALAALEEAARLDPAAIGVRYWHGAALLRAAAAGGSGPLDPDRVALAGMEFEAVFRLSLLDRTPGAQDLRRRAIALLDGCAPHLPAEEKRFAPWWKARRAELLAERPQSDLVHVVGPRDTLSAVAKRYYGDAAEAGRLAAANPEVDPRRLSVGQRLKVPGVPIELPRPAPRLDGLDAALVGTLRSAGSAAERRGAAERLALRDCSAGVPALAEALRTDESPWVRAECARALGRLADPAVEPVLAAALASDGSADCRREAALALGRLGGPGTALALLRGLSDPGHAVAAAAAASLGRLRTAEASGPLTAALSSPAESVRRSAALALRELAAAGRLAPADLDRLRRTAAAGGASAPMALLALCAADREGALAGLAAALGSGDQPLRRAACEAAADLAAGGRLERQIEERLTAALTSRDPAERLGAAAALARSAAREPRSARPALETLVTLLEEPRPVWWGEGGPRPAAEAALGELRSIAGIGLGPDPEAWRRWLERNR
jgi:HEAT repeat protein/nucleoid-associated protein YgaU